MKAQAVPLTPGHREGQPNQIRGAWPAALGKRLVLAGAILLVCFSWIPWVCAMGDDPEATPSPLSSLAPLQPASPPDGLYGGLLAQWWLYALLAMAVVAVFLIQSARSQRKRKSGKSAEPGPES